MKTIMLCLLVLLVLLNGCTQQTDYSEIEMSIDIYKPDKTWNGTTFLPDNHDPERPRVIEVDMEGNIIWEYIIPENLESHNNPGMEAELLENGNILIVLTGEGLREIERNGNIVWSYSDEKVSHDADRLPNGNTLFVFGNEDTKDDVQVKEINPEGEMVWSWKAADHFDIDTYYQGFTHTNAVLRMDNGNTLISPRNFNFLVEVDSGGEVVKTFGEGVLRRQHDPVILPNGNVLLANHQEPHEVLEFDSSGEIIWRFSMPSERIRDANRLPNGNTLVTGTTKIIEVTPEKEIVWQFSMKGTHFTKEEESVLGFYKAERIFE